MKKNTVLIQIFWHESDSLVEQDVPKGCTEIIPETDYEDDEQMINEEKKSKQARKLCKKTECYSWQDDIPESPLREHATTDCTKVLIPLEYFTQFFTSEIMNDIVYHKNLFSTQKSGISVDTNPSEITDFVSREF